MTQDEKELLLKDLCARLPYRTKIYSDGIPHEQTLIGFIPDIEYYNIKPYLRPLSSMTEEEKNDLRNAHIKDEQLFTQCIAKSKQGDNTMKGKVIPHFAVDWCNKNHFDYRGLIPMGLAIEAPEGIYKSNIERSVRNESA